MKAQRTEDTIGTASRLAVVLRGRADAARRHPPLQGRHGPAIAAYDPALPWPPAPRSPSTYSLSIDELCAEAERLVVAGWHRWEVRATLARPELVAV